MSARGMGMRVAAAFAAALAGARAQADDAAWGKAAGGTYDWTNTVNWLPGSAYPNGAGQAAYLTNDITGAPVIQLRQNIALGTLAIGDAAASANNYGHTLNNKSGEAFTLTFDSGAPGAPAVINTGSSGTPTVRLEAPMALQSDLRVNIGGTDSANRPNLTFSAVTAMNGRSIVFTNGVPGQGQITFASASDFTGDGAIVNNAGPTVNVDGKKAFAGRLVANRGIGGSNTGSFTLTTGGFTNAAEFEINGYLVNGNTQMGGSIHSGNNSDHAANPGQRWTTKRVTLNGGSLDDGGQRALAGTDSDWQRGLEYVRDDVAEVALSSGYSYLFINYSSSTTGTILNVGALLRSPGASAFVSGPNTTNKQLLVGNGAALLTGAGGASGSQTMSLIPWLAQHRPGDGTANPGTFSTWAEEGGIRGLADSEYATSVTAGAGRNVSVSSVTLASDATVNALRTGYMNSSPANNIGTNRTLTVTSGGLFFQIGNKYLGVSGSPEAGTLSFGSAEGVVWVLGSTTNTIGARITGTGGLTKAGSGLLVLTGDNGYSGPTHVGGGALRVGDGTFGSSLGSGDVAVHAGAVLQLSCAGAIADGATLTLVRAGPFAGRVSLDAGVDEAVKFLYMGEEPMPSGTYGSSASAAAVKDDRYFAGAGVLTVTGDATALKRGTLISVQ